MIVGEVTFAEIIATLALVDVSLRREVSSNIFLAAELTSKLAAGERSCNA